MNSLVISIAMLFYISETHHQKDMSFADFYLGKVKSLLVRIFERNQAIQNQLSIDLVLSKLMPLTQFLGLSTFVLSISFTLGVLTSNVSDSFIDQSNYFHLGLKKLWAPNSCAAFDYSDTDKYIKLQVFDNIFSPAFPVTEKEKLNFYYTSKHSILESKDWKEYLNYTQILVNLSQSFCFATWLLIITFSSSLFFMFFMKFMKEKKYRYSFEFFFIGSIFVFGLFNFFSQIILPDLASEYLKYALFILLFITIGALVSNKIRGTRTGTALIGLILSIFLYSLSGFAWKNAETESCSKTYGVMKFMNKELRSKDLEVIKKLK